MKNYKDSYAFLLLALLDVFVWIFQDDDTQ